MLAPTDDSKKPNRSTAINRSPNLHIYEEWLRANGFDPGALRMTIQSRRPGYSHIMSTAMHEACALGELGVCRYLVDHGVGEEIRARDNLGKTPMHWACKGGHLHVVRLGIKGQTFNRI